MSRLVDWDIILSCQGYITRLGTLVSATADIRSWSLYSDRKNMVNPCTEHSARHRRPG